MIVIDRHILKTNSKWSFCLRAKISPHPVDLQETKLSRQTTICFNQLELTKNIHQVGELNAIAIEGRDDISVFWVKYQTWVMTMYMGLACECRRSIPISTKNEFVLISYEILYFGDCFVFLPTWCWYISVWKHPLHTWVENKEKYKIFKVFDNQCVFTSMECINT